VVVAASAFVIRFLQERNGVLVEALGSVHLVFLYCIELHPSNARHQPSFQAMKRIVHS